MANDLKIFFKPYEPSDTLALLPLYQELGYPTTLESLQKRLTKLLSNKDYQLLLALSDGHICGFVAFAKLHFLRKMVLTLEFWVWLLVVVLDAKELENICWTK